MAHISIQAQALGLHVQQFRVFDRDDIAGELAIREHWEVATLAANRAWRAGLWSRLGAR